MRLITYGILLHVKGFFSRTDLHSLLADNVRAVCLTRERLTTVAAPFLTSFPDLYCDGLEYCLYPFKFVFLPSLSEAIWPRLYDFVMSSLRIRTPAFVA